MKRKINYEIKKDKINSALRMKYKPEEQKIKYKIKKDKINLAKRMKYKADKAKSSNNGGNKNLINNWRKYAEFS